jgi:hypothetical protein
MKKFLTLALATLASVWFVGGSLAQPTPSIGIMKIPNGTLLTPIHGCHQDYEWGWVRQWDTKARHRHSGYDCRPRGGGGGRDWDDRGDREGGPPPGWRRGGYGPGCMKVGPVWYCPPD